MKGRFVIVLAAALGHWSCAMADSPSGTARGEEKSSGSGNAAYFSDEFPTTVELFDALAARKNPRWRTLYRPPLGQTFPARTRSAFWLGVNISELYLAVHARDAQRVSNLCRDLESFGRNLGVSKVMHDGIVTLNGHAQKQDWEDARVEVGRTAESVKTALSEQGDGNLAVLVFCGEWVRNVEISASVVDEEAFDDLALAAGGQKVFARLDEELQKAEFAEKDDSRIRLLREQIGRLSELWQREGPTPRTMKDVTGTHASVTEILDSFSKNGPYKLPQSRDES